MAWGRVKLERDCGCPGDCGPVSVFAYRPMKTHELGLPICGGGGREVKGWKSGERTFFFPWVSGLLPDLRGTPRKFNTFKDN